MTRAFLSSRPGLAAIGVWALWYAGVLALKAWIRSAKDPGDYAGMCVKPSGYAVRCTLEQWMAFDTTPWVGLYTFVGGLLAAAATGLLFLRHLARAPDDRGS